MARHQLTGFDGTHLISDDQAKFVRERVRGFMSPFALNTLPLEHLMCEAYLQGLHDTVALMNAKGLVLPGVGDA